MKMCVPLFLSWNCELSARKSKGDEIFILKCWNIKLVKFGSLDIFFYSRRMRRANNFFMIFVNEGWGLWDVKSKYSQTLGDKIQILKCQGVNSKHPEISGDKF